MEYAIKIDGKYFFDYVYAEKDKKGRFGKGTILAGDIIDLVLTDEIERTEIRRSIGNTLALIYGVEKFKDKKTEIIPLGRD